MDGFLPAGFLDERQILFEEEEVFDVEAIEEAFESVVVFGDLAEGEIALLEEVALLVEFLLGGFGGVFVSALAAFHGGGVFDGVEG
ncbi:MAG: hypothetical protein ACK6DZ_14870, partial [Acidobacteriota bacterium]